MKGSLIVSNPAIPPETYQLIFLFLFPCFLKESAAVQKLIKNNWRRESGRPFATARILSHEIHPEGLDVDRIRFLEPGSLIPLSRVGHIISVLRGRAELFVPGEGKQPLQLEPGLHLYLPPGLEVILEAGLEAEFLQVSSPTASQKRGRQLLLRDETFLSACASGSQSLRWILTPQYLSRRIFLYHDPTLLSKSGNPVSWFHTTMFDVAGLPRNEEGVPVFKMSYNSRTEFNACYDVQGTARVRMALHPYQEVDQVWGPWLSLDGESSYHLNETAGGPEEEYQIDEKTGMKQFLRNKHEVHIVNGHVSLFCLFDPAPTGVERHRPGEYSDYEPLSQVLDSELYKTHQREILKYDDMLNQLSLARAKGRLSSFQSTPAWHLYLQGQKAQKAIEGELVKTLAAEGRGRERVLSQWMQSGTV